MKHVYFYAENRPKHSEPERYKKYIGYFRVMKGVSRHVFVRIGTGDNYETFSILF
ncbi:TPA: hypothetical protein ACU25N_000485 [Staphylococcus aureus]